MIDEEDEEEMVKVNGGVRVEGVFIRPGSCVVLRGPRTGQTKNDQRNGRIGTPIKITPR